MVKRVKKVTSILINYRKCCCICDNINLINGIGRPSLIHALVVIFLEYFAWGLLMMPIMSNLIKLFPNHAFLMNGIIMGIKGLLAFLSAPLIGSLSDLWGRKFFLFCTVFFTCLPIPILAFNVWWFFVLTSISGILAVTFSVVFAYVADITKEADRSGAYGIVTATFAASFIISPALGAHLLEKYSELYVIIVATAISIFDVLFIVVAIPESLPSKLTNYRTQFSWKNASPFSLNSIKKFGNDKTVVLLCFTVVFSFIPEAGLYSCIFVYIRYVVGFSADTVAMFIGIVGILSVICQSLIGILMKIIGPKRTILLGIFCEALHLLWFSFATFDWMVWTAGFLASVSSITYPAISAYVSMHSDADKQGLIQGILTGVRSLCNGIGPALFGLFFYFFNIDLNLTDSVIPHNSGVLNTNKTLESYKIMRGPPFLFGMLMSLLALIFASFIPNSTNKLDPIYNSFSNNSIIDADINSRNKKNDSDSSPILL